MSRSEPLSSGVEVPAHLAVAILMAAGVVPGDAPAPAAQSAARAVPHRAAVLADDQWLELLHAHGETAGVALAKRVFKTGSGRIYVPVAEDRQDILALKRNQAVVSRVMALAAKANAQELEQQLGRPATMSEIFAAHVLGAQGAADLIAAAATEPQRPSIEVLPAAALQYPGLFFDRTRPRSCAGVLEALSNAFEKAVQTDIGAKRAAASKGALPKSSTWATQVSSTVVRR